MADERLEPPRQQSSYFAPVASNPNPESTPSSNTASNNASTANIAAPPPPAEPRHRFRPLRTLQPRQSNIRIRRAPAPRTADPNNPANPYHVRSMLDVDGNHQPQDQQSIHLRRLSGGSPVPGDHRNAHPLQQQQQPPRSMLDVEDNTGPDGNTEATDFGGAGPGVPPERKGLFHRFSRAHMRPDAANNPRRQQLSQQDEYDSNIVDMLDVVDPEVSTLSSITNVQNSLFVPSLGRWVNRRPTYNLTRYSDLPGGAYPSGDGGAVAEPSGRRPPESRQQGAPRPGGPDRPLKDVEEEDEAEAPARPSVERIPSYMTERFYAVRPKDTSLAEWSDEDLAELNDHVRHMLHSKRSAFKRSMKAFGQYVRRPLGFAVTLYAFLITVFGFAWVLFLIGWVYLGDEERRDYIIDVIDNVLVALFAVVGDGMIPWRLVDTYHMCFIARYYHLTWKLRNKMHVPELKDHNDLPSEPVIAHRTEQEDIEAQRDIHMKQSEEHSVLSPTQQATLEHHQACFSKSHTFYKPHETETHYAFPLRLLVAIVVLLDFHSCFQLALGLCTWLIDYHVRPAALTATILSCSIAVNITAGVLISVGDRRTRKKDVVERMFRQELTQEAIRRIESRKEREEEERNRLENIDEESPESKSRGASVDLGERLKQTLKRKNSDEGRARSSKSLDIARKQRKSSDIARKPVNHVGMFDSSISGGLAEEGEEAYFSEPKADTKPESNPTGPSTKE